MSTSIQKYNESQEPNEKAICEFLMHQLQIGLPDAESKIWHAHPVWFLDGNPIVGYSKQKAGVRLMFWSGADFDEDELIRGTGKFKDASITYTDCSQINVNSLQRWISKSREIQWDYKHIVKRKGKLLLIA